MTKTIYVTRSAQMAAQALVERGKRFDRPVSESIVRIAKARRASPAEQKAQVEQTA